MTVGKTPLPGFGKTKDVNAAKNAGAEALESLSEGARADRRSGVFP